MRRDGRLTVGVKVVEVLDKRVEGVGGKPAFACSCEFLNKLNRVV